MHGSRLRDKLIGTEQRRRVQSLGHTYIYRRSTGGVNKGEEIFPHAPQGKEVNKKSVIDSVHSCVWSLCNTVAYVGIQYAMSV